MKSSGQIASSLQNQPIGGLGRIEAANRAHMQQDALHGPSSALEVIGNRLVEIFERISISVNDLEALADRVFGAQPSAEQKAYTANDSVGAIAQLDRIAEGLDRHAACLAEVTNRLATIA